jgi:hypothetical protein
VPHAAPLGGPHQLSAPLRFQVLRVSFEISADDPAIRDALRFLIQSATQPEPAGATVSYDVRRTDGGYEITRDGELVDVQFDSSRVLATLYKGIQRDALDAWPGAPVLFALTGRHGDERFMVVGSSLRERSRLGLELISHDVEVEGDDMAILHDGVVTAYPRPLRVCGADARVPPGAQPKEELPFVGDTIETGSWVLDLAQAGVDWRITTGRPDTLIHFETNYGGQTRLSEIPRHEMAKILMSHCDPRGNPIGAVRAVAELASRARRCARVWLGSLEHIGSKWPGLT